MTGKKPDAEAAAAPAPARATAPAPARLGAAEPGDPLPRNEPLHPTANKWYGANGKLYFPITDEREFKERGKASVLPSDQEGQPTASGEIFSTRGLSAAHSRLPIPSFARVTNLRTGRTAIVRVNDRGAYDRDEAIAISAAAAQKIQLADRDEVEVERITPAEIAAMPATRAAAAAQAPAAAPTPPAPPPAAAAAVQAAPVPAEPTPLPPPQPVAVEPAPPPAPVAAAPAPMPVTPMPAPAPVAPAPRAAAAPAPAPVPAPAPRVAAAPVAAAVAPAAPRAPSSAMGRWSVQVAAFATDSMAESTRARVAQTLAASGASLGDAERTPRVERRGNRSYVLLGDFADRDAAEALAGRLRAVLRQDVVVDRY